ncbi:hypothetical protein PF002_g24347 [Phytophthora fragariae]|uniref:Uncharacterized protein n=1 Tax=Phytophthora fragariae TaxID=53985 RepID=A0A6A3WVP9_9STRA|nr:hypothetical protein PF002_g24347 [Phytophthora fragariae]
MSSTSESGGGSAGHSAYHVMERDIKPWDLYSLDGAENPDRLDIMKEYFTRYRQLRGKKTNNAYTHDALQRSWCAFIRRWNAAGREGLSFTSWLEDREAARSTRSIGDLRTRVCEMLQREWRLCYVHLVEGCTRCQDRPRPTREEWERQVMSWTLSEDERRWLGRYDRARRDLEVAASRGSGRRETRERARSRSRSRSPGHVRWRRSRSHSPAPVRPRSRSRDRGRLQEGGYGTPTYPQPASAQASAPDNASRVPADEWRAYSQYQGSREGDSRGWRAYRDQPSAPRRIAAPPMHPQAAGAHHAGTEFAAALLGSERTDASEHLTPQQYRLMVQEADQARDEAMEAQNLAESARERAAAAEAAATRSEQGRREMMERLRYLESIVCGAPRSATPSREEQGLWPTRRQRRQRGGSDYAPAAGTQAPAQESSQECRA